MLARWDPVREFNTIRRWMDELMREAMRPITVWEGEVGLRGTWVPPMDVYETDDAIVVKVSLPGVKPEDVEIKVTGDTLTIEAKMEEEVEEEGATYYLRERRMGTFVRSIQLPAPVVPDEAEATFENGVLTLRLPKAEEARPKVISIGKKNRRKK